MIKQNIGHDLVIFGAKGDLSCRKLLPALYQLEKKNKLNHRTRIIGVGRANWNKESYANVVYKSLKNFLYEKINEDIWKKLFHRLEFCNIDINYSDHFIQLKKIIDQANNIVIHYLAMPPHTFSKICKGLGLTKLNLEPTRIIIEKPLGFCLKTSIEINNNIGKFFSEKQIFRIDHYLGKETIQNLLAFRFSNSLFYHNWNNKFIDHIQITVSEEVGVEGRFDYFDKAGQLKDMVQNHLLQILTIITMSQPNNFCEENIRNEKVKILNSLRPFTIYNIHQNLILGQYTSGVINKNIVPSYLEEIGSKNDSSKKTETFVSMKTYIDNSQWSGIPFYLRTGKRLPKKSSEIIVFFKALSTNIFEKKYSILPKNKLVFSLQPNEGIKIYLLNKIPELSSKYKLEFIDLDFNYSKNFYKYQLPDAYEKLLLETMKGIQSLFVRRDEVESSWIWIDSIFNSLNYFEPKLPELYPAGTWGPISSKKMINKDGHEWNESM